MYVYKYTHTRVCVYIEREHCGLDDKWGSLPGSFLHSSHFWIESWLICEFCFCNGMGMLVILIRMTFSNQFKTKNKALLSAGELSWFFWLIVSAKILQVKDLTLLQITALIRFISWKTFSAFSTLYCLLSFERVFI